MKLPYWFIEHAQSISAFLFTLLCIVFIWAGLSLIGVE